MADIIDVQLQAVASILADPISLLKNFRVTLAGTSYLKTRQSIPTGATAEALQKGEVTTIKYALIVNEDTANPVTILNQATVSGAVTLTEIPAGEAVWFRPNATNIYAVATTGAVSINFVVFGG